MLEVYLSVIILILLLHYVIFLSGIIRGLDNLNYPVSEIPNDDFISIIIPFRNESANILESYRSITAQDYPKGNYEVIYVNDSSDDDSLEKLISSCPKGMESAPLEDSYEQSNIKIITVPEKYSLKAHKKRAIRFGIENSRGKIIITTDADCIHHPNWLKRMIQYFDETTGFVSGPVEFYHDEKLFSRMQRIEFVGLVLTGAGLIGINKPIICNAANIAYRRSVFDKVNGFMDNMNLSSGDDEFLMQKIRKKTGYSVKFCMQKEAIVKTNPNKTVKQFFNQRKRWASKGLFYADKFLVVKLILIFLFYMSIVLMPFFSVFVSIHFIQIFILCVSLKFFLEYRIIRKGSELLFNKEILDNFFLAEFFQVPYIIFAGISGLFGNFIWKGRRIKR